MTAAIQRERKSGSLRGAHAESARLTPRNDGTVIWSAICCGPLGIPQCFDGPSCKWPLGLLPCANHVNDYARQKDYSGITDFLLSIRALEKDKEKSDACQQRWNWVEPHPTWARQF